MGSRKTGKAQVVARWSAPNIGRTKINVDASIVAESSTFVLGMILRDHVGAFIQAKNLCCAGEISVIEAESRGVLEALRWVNTMQLSNEDIECDSLLTVNAIIKEKRISWRLVRCWKNFVILLNYILILLSLLLKSRPIGLPIC